MPHCQLHHLSFTLPQALTAADLTQLCRQLFHIDNLDPAAVKLPRGRHGYREAYSLTGDHGAELISIQLSGVAGNLRNTSHIDVHGAALESGGGDQRQLCREIIDRGGWVTRVDLAADDVDGHIPWSEIVECSRAEQYENRITTTTCRPRRNRNTGEMEPSPPVYMRETGESIYYGKPDSDLSVVAYTRRGPVRIETRLRNRAAATEIIRRIADGAEIQELTLGTLRRNLIFHVPGYRRKDRRPIAPWWEAFLTAASPLKLPRQREAGHRSPWCVPPTRASKVRKALERSFAGASPTEARAILDMLAALVGVQAVPAF